MNTKNFIEDKLQKIVKELTGEDIKVSLTIPNDVSHGDWSSNVALQIAKKIGKNPMELAEEIVHHLQLTIDDLRFDHEKNINGQSSIINSQCLDRVEAIKPGFINFYLSEQALDTNLQQVLRETEKVAGITKVSKEAEGSKASKGEKLKAIVEYSSPNIAKPFTVGHLRSTIIGDAIANLLQAVGYEVYRDNHLGDWGTQFGKQIYAIKTWGSEEDLNKSENPIKDLVALYVKFHEEAEKNPELEEEGRKWFKKLEDGDAEARRLWQKCIDWSFKEFDRIYGELGVTFTENGGRGYGEASFEGKMQPVIDELKEKGLLKEDKGAELVFFPKDKYPPLMILKSDGATLYATRDLATDRFRLAHYGKDILVINEVGAEQSLYWKQIFETEYLLGWYKPGQRVHVGHGMFRFKEGKMSTRKGNVIWLEDVLQEAEKRALSLIKHEVNIEGTEAVSTNKKVGKAASRNILGVAQQLNTAREVAIGALKWNDLKRSPHLDITFDWNEILNMQGNSGPYVQYTYTRTQSVLSKFKSQNSEGKIDTKYQILNTTYSPQNEESLLLRKIVHFPEIVEAAAENFSPNMVTEYLFELSQLFNNFYQKYRILNAGSSTSEVKGPNTSEVNSFEVRDFRLALTQGVGVVLKQGLHLLGIKAPERM